MSTYPTRNFFQLKAKAKNEHFNEAIKKLNVAKTAKSNAIERARATLAIKRAAFENAQLSIIRAKNRVYVGKGDKKDITTLYECSGQKFYGSYDIFIVCKVYCILFNLLFFTLFITLSSFQLLKVKQGRTLKLPLNCLWIRSHKPIQLI